MNSVSKNDFDYDFIDLDRTFHELLRKNNDDIDINWGLYTRESFHWPDLIKKYRLIILSEAGSGKTAEIRNVADTLRKQGQSAFFLRLENIPGNFEDAFEVGTYEAFKKWLESNEEGWLLLDSVDEARLRNPSDFELAIRKLSNKIKVAQDRTHIIITSRTPAWRPKTDLDYCNYHLPFTVASTLECDSQSDNNDDEGLVRTKTEHQERYQSVFTIFSLDDLTSDQVEIFVEAKGIKESKAFLDAVERKDAWSFTTRPQDLQELTEFWIDNNRIGNRFEIMRNSIDRRLAERTRNRAEARPLSVERIRQGARLLAAATTLGQNPTIRVPDDVSNDIQSLLPDWDESEQLILLLRPIFDEAIYGTVRFHHRSVREYLTAEWFAELLKHQTSRRNIERLFFSNQYGLDIIVPTLRPILPWLIILDEKIRKRVQETAPEIIFEGGDPSELPLDVRRHILKEVCDHMAKGFINHSMRNHEAVQRFASLDLSDDIRDLLQQYIDNDDLTVFLLRMVWIGKIVNALPEAMDIALTPSAKKHVRIAAFRAVKVIGSSEDNETLRKAFLAESVKLNRECLAELIDNIQPTEQILEWVVLCLEKSESKKLYSVDVLTGKVADFVNVADIKLLPGLIIFLNKLLGVPPLIDSRFCQISKEFQWLMDSASTAIERAILTRHPISLTTTTLEILHKISSAHGYGIDHSTNMKDKFSALIPTWQELNRVLFWFEVQQVRESLSLDMNYNQKLTNFEQVSIFGSFWRFEESDFEYVGDEISHQMLMDDKLVALSLAFYLYRLANRPSAWRKQLKRLVADSKELSERLNNYLKPPAQNQEWKKEDAKHKRRFKASQAKQDKYHVNWKKSFDKNLNQFRSSLQDNPGTTTDPIVYLLNQTREKNTTGRWADYNWKMLAVDYGEDVARFYRDSAVAFWRHYKPILQSEGAQPNTIPYAVIIGLAGIEIESNEVQNWPMNLSTGEVELACRYASHELNGFPTWLPLLFEIYSNSVCDFFMGEIRYELSIEKIETETHYIISDVSFSGQWAWNYIAPNVYKILDETEPQNLSNLEKLIKIIRESTLSDAQIERLASRKCHVLEEQDHLACWFAVWAIVAPDIALVSLKTQIENIAGSEKQTLFAMTFITRLWDAYQGARAEKSLFKNPEYLKIIYLLMHEYIRQKEDINRDGTGVYSPGLRDNAQSARNSLLHLLKEIPGKESFLALRDITNIHPERASEKSKTTLGVVA
jgi:hypothetical protein